MAELDLDCLIHAGKQLLLGLLLLGFSWTHACRCPAGDEHTWSMADWEWNPQTFTALPRPGCPGTTGPACSAKRLKTESGRSSPTHGEWEAAPNSLGLQQAPRPVACQAESNLGLLGDMSTFQGLNAPQGWAGLAGQQLQQQVSASQVSPSEASPSSNRSEVPPEQASRSASPSQVGCRLPYLHSASCHDFAAERFAYSRGVCVCNHAPACMCLHFTGWTAAHRRLQHK